MFGLFTTLVYQPFFNILVLFYLFLDKVTGNGDMGIAVILLTILIRILLLPISLASHRSEKERRLIGEQAKELETKLQANPVQLSKQKKQLLRRNRRVLAAEIVTLCIQVALALMLWRIFASGLKGSDLHLLYGFIPEIREPFNLVFLDKYDLTRTSFTLNLIQTICIFILETISLYISPFPVTKHEVVRLQLVLPLVSFVIFMGLPSGKKLFVITTLIFSIILVSYKAVNKWFANYKAKQARQSDQSEAVLVSEG